MAKKQKYLEDQLIMRSSRFGGQLIKFEKTSFGWEFLGYDTDEEITGIDWDRGKVHSKVFKRLFFTRPNPYSKNFLFKLIEFIANIISFFRRLFLNLLPIALIACVLMSALNPDAWLVLAWGTFCGVYGGLIAATLLLSVLGRILKKAFKIEEKLETAMTDAGYDYDR